MTSKTDYWEAALLNYETRGTAMPAITPHFALFTTTCSDSAAGTETTYGGYARQAISTSNFGTAATAGTIANTATISFPAKSDAGTAAIVAVGIKSAASGGNLLRYHNLAASVPINQNDVPRFAVGAAVVNED